MKTLLDTLQGGTKYLEQRGVEDARLNMEYLLAKVLRCERMDLYLDFDRPLIAVSYTHLTLPTNREV